jgi:homoserine dehydrogenase
MNVRVALSGFGNVGQGLATLLRDRNDLYESRYGVRFLLTAVRDRGGFAANPDGLDPQGLLDAKSARGTVAASGGQEKTRDDGFVHAGRAQVLVEAASTNFSDAEPGWSYVRGALHTGVDVVLASKGSLALYWHELMTIAATKKRRVLYSATVGSPVPSLEIADRVLVGADVLGFEGILNSTTHVILTVMGEGASYDEGVRRAQEMGMAETDPTLDVDGWDAAAKVLIVANTVFGASLRIGDIRREGIRGVTASQLADARAAGQAVKLIGRAQRSGGGIAASVAPERRPLDDALGRLTGDAMGIVFDTEPLGKIAATAEPSGEHGGGITTAMTVIRDLINLARDRGWARQSPA